MTYYAQNTPEWLAMRKTKIGASDAPVIMGLSPWKTPYQLWEEKLGLCPETEKTAAMERGTAMEEQARQEFERMTGLIVFPQVMQHPHYDWMIASLDGIDIEQKNVVEIKCPGKADHETALQGKVPDKYYAQLQHQMEVANVRKLFYFSFNGIQGKIVEVEQNREYIENLILKELEFFKCMEELRAPPTTSRDYLEKDDDIWRAASLAWMECHDELQTLKAREEELRETLIALSRHSNAVGAGLKLSRVIRKGPIDYQSIPELKDLDLEKYRKPIIESWRITKYA